MKIVPSTVEDTGNGGDGEDEWADYSLYLPLDPEDRQKEARTYFERLMTAAPTVLPLSARSEVLTKLLKSAAEDTTIVSQHRAGRFTVECRFLDGTQTVGIGAVKLEVLFKGRFSDFNGPIGYWEAPPQPTKPAPEHPTAPRPGAPLRK